MATLLLCSASGAPGVTLTALGLALTWPRDVLLVDADRTPSQAVLAGYLRGVSARDRGLPGVLQAHRERRPLSEALVDQAVDLPEPIASGSSVSRRFLPGFVHLGSVDLFGGVWRELGLALQAAPFDAVVDAGRIGHRGLPGDLVEASDKVWLVCRSSLVSLAAVRLYLSALVEQAGEGKVGLVLVGPGRPYGAKEVSEQFGVGVQATIAWDAPGAADLHEGQPLSKRWGRQALAASYARTAAEFVAQDVTERARIGAPA
ncbi:MAG TPA: hypothetical protein PKX10_07160 [Propioniciclava tarda]|nr:hypothetical protein [Propioniciclava tarda]